jgi:hypothetical protein
LHASTIIVETAAAFLAGEAAAAFAAGAAAAAADFLGAGDAFFLGTEAFLGAGDAFLGTGEAFLGADLTTFLALAAAVCFCGVGGWGRVSASER